MGAWSRTHRLGVVVAVTFGLVCGGVAFAADSPPRVSSVELVEEAALWDGRRVTFEGEAIGDVMVRGDRAWLHVNDDAYAQTPVPAGGDLSGFNSGHAVYAPASEAEKVDVFGGYRTRGDIVRVTGTFRAADPEHGGDMIIEADRIEVVEAGFPIERQTPPWRLWLLGALTLSTGATYAAYRRRSAASRH